MRTIFIKALNDDSLAVQFSYSPEFVAKMKTLRNRSWHPEHKYWTIPNSNESVAQLFAAFEGIVQAKGRKERFTILSQAALKLLLNYFDLFKPSDWIFPGNPPDTHISERTVQHIFEHA